MRTECWMPKATKVISRLVFRWDISTTSEISPCGSRSAVSCWKCSL